MSVVFVYIDKLITVSAVNRPPATCTTFMDLMHHATSVFGLSNGPKRNVAVYSNSQRIRHFKTHYLTFYSRRNVWLLGPDYPRLRVRGYHSCFAYSGSNSMHIKQGRLVHASGALFGKYVGSVPRFNTVAQLPDCLRTQSCHQRHVSIPVLPQPWCILRPVFLQPNWFFRHTAVTYACGVFVWGTCSTEHAEHAQYIY